jgi:hypothetical protein
MIFINVLVRLNQIDSFREKLFVKLLIYLLLFLIGRILCENIFLQCPQDEVENRSVFVEVTLQKTFNQNYINKLSLDYAAFQDIVEKAVSNSYS